MRQPLCLASAVRRDRPGFKGGAAPICQTAMFNVAWAGSRSVTGPKPVLRTPPKRLSGRRRERTPARRGQVHHRPDSCDWRLESISERARPGDHPCRPTGRERRCRSAARPRMLGSPDDRNACRVNVYCLESRDARRAKADCPLGAVGRPPTKQCSCASEANRPWIDYQTTVSGNLGLVPSGTAQMALAEDYTAMLPKGMLPDNDEPFDALTQPCCPGQEGWATPRA